MALCGTRHRARHVHMVGQLADHGQELRAQEAVGYSRWQGLHARQAQLTGCTRLAFSVAVARRALVSESSASSSTMRAWAGENDLGSNCCMPLVYAV